MRYTATNERFYESRGVCPQKHLCKIVNKIQNTRKDNNFDVTDKINIFIQSRSELDTAVNNWNSYICSQTLGNSIEIVKEVREGFCNIDINPHCSPLSHNQLINKIFRLLKLLARWLNPFRAVYYKFSFVVFRYCGCKDIF
jgi:hypothetical protein